MNIHKITDPNEIDSNHFRLRGYAGLGLEEALKLYFDRYKKMPEDVYILKNKTMQAIYCVVPEEP